MPIPFDRYDYLKLKDLERSPYVIWSQAEVEWSKKDNHRMLLIALDRYAETIAKREARSGLNTNSSSR